MHMEPHPANDHGQPAPTERRSRKTHTILQALLGVGESHSVEPKPKGNTAPGSHPIAIEYDTSYLDILFRREQIKM